MQIMCIPIAVTATVAMIKKGEYGQTYISPRNILTAFCAIACLHPPTSSPVSSRDGIDRDTALAAFHWVDPH